MPSQRATAHLCLSTLMCQKHNTIQTRSADVFYYLFPER